MMMMTLRHAPDLSGCTGSGTGASAMSESCHAEQRVERANAEAQELHTARLRAEHSLSQSAAQLELLQGELLGKPPALHGSCSITPESSSRLHICA